MTGREFRLKRVSLPAGAADGSRVLVDRLWPRGISRQRAQIDLWCRGRAAGGRGGGACTAKAWAGTRSSRLFGRAGATRHRGPVTLLYAALDETHNNAIALKELLDRRVAPSP